MYQIYLASYILPSDIFVNVDYINAKSGNFKVVVFNDGKIIDEIPLDAFSETLFYENLEGDFSIHIAGESAAFEMNIDVE